MRCLAGGWWVVGGGWWALRRHGVLLSLASMISLSAHAGVVQGGYGVSGYRQGYAGEQVSLSIDESALSGFEFGQLLFT